MPPPLPPWRALPAGTPVRLADDCPFRPSILFAIPLNEGAGFPQILPGLRSPLPFTLDQPSWKPQVIGITLDGTDSFATNTVRTASQNPLAGLTGVTYSSIIGIRTFGGYRGALRHQTAFAGHQTRFGDGTSGNVTSAIVDSGGTWREVTANSLPVGVYNCVVTWSAASNAVAAYYLNQQTGAIYSGSASAGGATALGSSSTNLALLGNETPGEAWSGYISSICFLNRGVSADEALRIMLRPNQFFDVIPLFAFKGPSSSGPISVSPDPISVRGSSVNPTVRLGALALTPGGLTVVARSVDPAVRQGSLALTPGAPSATVETVSPAVQQGALSLSPAAAASVASVVAPTVRQGSLSLTPGALSAVAVGVPPTVQTSALSITPSPAAAVAASIAPSVRLGALSLTPAAISARASAVDPALLFGSVSLTPAAAAAIVSAVAPSIVGSAVNVTPDPITAIAARVNPSVLLGGLILSLTPGGVRVQSVSPTALLSALSLTPAPAVAVVRTRLGAVYVVSQTIDGVIRRIVFPASRRRVLLPPSVRRVLFPRS